jgi:hypothetical protein
MKISELPGTRSVYRLTNRALAPKSKKLGNMPARMSLLRTLSSNKPENRFYFRGPENVERVQRWRECHPGYWRKNETVTARCVYKILPSCP